MLWTRRLERIWESEKNIGYSEVDRNEAGRECNSRKREAEGGVRDRERWREIEREKRRKSEGERMR